MLLGDIREESPMTLGESQCHYFQGSSLVPVASLALFSTKMWLHVYKSAENDAFWLPWHS